MRTQGTGNQGLKSGGTWPCVAEKGRRRLLRSSGVWCMAGSRSVSRQLASKCSRPYHLVDRDNRQHTQKLQAEAHQFSSGLNLSLHAAKITAASLTIQAVSINLTASGPSVKGRT